jgi:hypothetical protein
MSDALAPLPTPELSGRQAKKLAKANLSEAKKASKSAGSIPGAFEAQGANGKLIITEEKVMIVRKGAIALLTQGFKGDKDILIEDISSIQVRKPKMGTRGYIQFAYHGGQETKGALLDAVKDENTLLFDKKHWDGIAKAKELVEQYRSATRAANRAPAAAQSSDLDELKKLGDLRDSGILSDDEFEAKKKLILGL